MIFVTVGTTQFPFYRMISKVIVLAQLYKNEYIIFQNGCTPIPTTLPTNVRGVGVISSDAYTKHLRQARAVLSHGGVGAVMQSLHFQKKPIIFPRLSRFNEHVDDHQLCFAKYLREKKLANAIFSEKDEDILKQIDQPFIDKNKISARRQRFVRSLRIHITSLIGD